MAQDGRAGHSLQATPLHNAPSLFIVIRPSTSLSLLSDRHIGMVYFGIPLQLTTQLLVPWVVISSILASWCGNNKLVSMAHLCRALEDCSGWHGGPRSLSSSSCMVLSRFDLIFMSPGHKTALATKPGIKLG